jgi:ABC-type multidrug transport system fused ATPase/permease subunit
MYLEIGFASFAAVGSLLALIPIQGAFAKQFGKLRKGTVKYRDERIKSISDSLAGMMVVKLYAWERAFQSQILKLRQSELSIVRKASTLRALNEAFYFASSAVIQIFAFITFWLMGGVFTPARIFTCIVYMSSIRLSMTNFYPKALQFISESMVSFQRIQAFLALPEISQSRNLEEEIRVLKELGGGGINDDDVEIVLKDAWFKWGGGDSKGASGGEITKAEDADDKEKKEEQVVKSPSDDIPSSSPKTSSEDDGSKTLELAPFSAATAPTTIGAGSQPILKNLNLVIKRGTLVGVIGPVGSGKSSFLNALLGEMDSATPTTKLAVRSRIPLHLLQSHNNNNNNTSSIPDGKGDLSLGEGRVAYCAQNPYILSGTVKENILFGKPFDEHQFWKAIKMADMERDLELIGSTNTNSETEVLLSLATQAAITDSKSPISPLSVTSPRSPTTTTTTTQSLLKQAKLLRGIETLIGERGVTLSGGQRARLALARAIYTNPTLLLLDDPLSAVDPRVAKHLFEKCILKLVEEENKTVVLVTHQVQFVRRCREVVVLEGGEVVGRGRYAEDVLGDADVLRRSRFVRALKEMEEVRMKSAGNASGAVVEDEIDVDGLMGADEEREVVDGEKGKGELEIEDADGLVGTIAEEKEKESAVAKKDKKKEGTAGAPASGTVGAGGGMVKEDLAKGNVPLSTYIAYFRAGASVLLAFILFQLLVVGEASLVCTDWYLSRWSLQTPEDQRWIGHPAIFLSLALGTLVVSVGRAVLFFQVCLNSSEKLFEEMLGRVFRSPMSFFQENPHGRMIK